MKINKEQGKDLIYNLRGKFFGVTFVKKDGSIRDMTCRTGVAKHLKVGGMKLYNYNNLIVVFDVQINDYRNVNIDTLKSLRANGRSYYVN